MKAPMTEQNLSAWQAMVDTGMDKQVAFERLADWARMLEERLAFCDPNYQAYQWGQQKPQPAVTHLIVERF